MVRALAFLALWWYCYDDHLAEWLNTPQVGTVPLWLWFIIWLACAIGAAREQAKG